MADIFLVALLAVLMNTADVQAQGVVAARDGAPDCRQKRAQWESEFAKIPPGPPSYRLKAIETLAGKVGEDPEECVAESIRRTLQAERARFLTIRINEETVTAAAVYSCTKLTRDLKCLSSVADDTAHLGETLSPVLTLAPGQTVRLQLTAEFRESNVRIYIAPEASLMDSPAYAKLKLGKSKTITLPTFSQQIVLVAILKEPRSGLFDKFVWLVKPEFS